MNSDERHVHGPRPIGALLPRLVRPAFRRRSAATAQVLADWDAIVGPAIAAVTTPRRLATGTLTIACAGPIALELQHLADEVLMRINTHFGRPVVTALRFVQTHDLLPPAAPRPVAADPAGIARVETALAGLPQGELRGALAALGQTLLTFSNRSRSA
jgi:hypothetical protein